MEGKTKVRAAVEKVPKSSVKYKLATKKSKKFADKSFMELAVNTINEELEQKIQQNLEKESLILKKLIHARSKKQSKKETNRQKIDKIKQTLRGSKTQKGPRDEQGEDLHNSRKGDPKGGKKGGKRGDTKGGKTSAKKANPTKRVKFA